ncbi:MAG: glycerol-3-phosphate cytidylyltransferase [Clostridia bacterium]|jgi:glycerol-3-phosphate cytidylyltransferase|nr:glycerol-3-phosphate cytidylyltransferase [Clostridia bacterium]
MLLTIEQKRAEGKKIGFTSSTFDLLHTGHVSMLSECKSNCDYLVVGLLTDPTRDRPKTKSKPVQSVMERWIQLQAISYVDLIIPFESEQDLYDLLLLIHPDIRFVGEEYKGRNFTGSDIESIEIYFNCRKHSFSSTDLRARISDNSLTKASEEDKIKELEALNSKRKENENKGS